VRIIVAESAGFCFGVERAVQLAEAAIAASAGSPVYTLGPLIHNRSVTDDLAARGVRELRSVADLDDAGDAGGYGIRPCENDENAQDASATVITNEPQPATVPTSRNEVAGLARASVITRAHGTGASVRAQLAERGVRVIDATCPFVAKIHEIVKNAEQNGDFIVLMGEANHAEVLAIAEYSRNCKVFSVVEELAQWLESDENAREMRMTVVFQTTSRREIFKSVDEITKKLCTNARIFDTICDATNRRQAETRELARTCDAVIVIGGRESANTRRLFEIAREVNPNTQLIESADELSLPQQPFWHSNATIAITAGASTPAWIIKEVKRKMFEETEVRIDEPTTTTENMAEETAVEPVAPVEEERELTLDELYDASFKTIRTGERVTGYIAAITPTEITVDLGAKQSGYIPLSELTSEEAVNELAVGGELEAIVMRVNDVEGTIMLSQRRLDAIKAWSDIEAAVDSKAVLEGTVTEENKGGVVVTVRGVRVFVPASRTGLPRDAEMAQLMKQKVRLVIKEVNQPRRRVVGSISDVTYAERAEKAEAVWAEIEEGKHYNGTVKSLTAYGAFVDIGGVDGMVHVSELSWAHISKPADYISVGDEIDVFVLSFDKEKRKISLGHKDRSQNPWDKFVATCQIGDNVTVKVVKLMKFGAFAEVIPGVDGLIHVSQLAGYRVEDPSEVVNAGDVVDVKITDIDFEKKKISLSIRALLASAAPAAAEEYEEAVAAEAVEEAPVEE